MTRNQRRIRKNKKKEKLLRIKEYNEPKHSAFGPEAWDYLNEFWFGEYMKETI
jgi:hypothetical protein